MWDLQQLNRAYTSIDAHYFSIVTASPRQFSILPPSTSPIRSISASPFIASILSHSVFHILQRPLTSPRPSPTREGAVINIASTSTRFFLLFFQNLQIKSYWAFALICKSHLIFNRLNTSPHSNFKSLFPISPRLLVNLSHSSRQYSPTTFDPTGDFPVT